MYIKLHKEKFMENFFSIIIGIFLNDSRKPPPPGGGFRLISHWANIIKVAVVAHTPTGEKSEANYDSIREHTDLAPFNHA